LELISNKRKKGELNLPLVYFLVAGGGVFAVIILRSFNRLPHFPCVFKTVTGFPCPTCGSTRVVTSLLKFDIIEAFGWNPLVFLIGIAFIIWVSYGFYMQISGKKIKIRLSKKESLFIKLVLLILFFSNWIYLVIFNI